MRTLFFLFFFVLVTLCTAWLMQHPGTIHIDWQGYYIETSVTVSIISLFVLFLIFYLLLRLWFFLKSFSQKLYIYKTEKRVHKGLIAFIEAQTALEVGANKEARAKAEIIKGCFENDVLYLSILANLALVEGDFQAAERLFLQIRTHSQGNFKALCELVKISMSKGELLDAYKDLQELLRIYPHGHVLLKKAFKVAFLLKKYEDAHNLLKRLAADKFISPLEKNRFEALILFEQAQALVSSSDASEACYLLKKAHSLAPDLIPISLSLAGFYKTQKQLERAEKVIETTWMLTPYLDLADIYESLRTSGTFRERYERMERLASFNPHHSQTYIMLLKFALHFEMEAKARVILQQFEEEYDPTVLSYRLKAQLELQERGDEIAARKWLECALTASPDARWQCSNCLAIQEVWISVCPCCHALASLQLSPHLNRGIE